jgi:hypothetical protein
VADSATFASTLEDGTQVQVTVKKTGADKGQIEVKKWRGGKDPKSVKPDARDTAKLYEIRASKDGSRATSKADVGGFLIPDPTVTFTVNESQRPVGPRQSNSKPTVTVEIVGVGAGRTTYDITEDDHKSLLDFLKDAEFPE